MNNFPELKLILEPGGCAYYEFPVNPEETNSFIQPARKLRPGELYEVCVYLFWKIVVFFNAFLKNHFLKNV